ncbi:FecR family protein [Parabacteroides gordonii]|jgi:ferric-dicitrate binding protein FerR (iron transport regulator)|uniref:FecR protein domain-containing protein n=1 Tax=Parabacteroides gordonii MS-1 = DSM 23371 TaxID=1203610 RepID=A0A0F5JJY6_9BACT|nr:FecR family protein [Parabacteroides gordonii]KKB57905.1 hypothetical protein HMPREF1536_01714 [Parabacteroides gordonii MS-1 = DSM 23371]MCA5582905.1 FecR domain-containing protein [Parabacteroides gordonii]RGP11164.1 DUF4974 domain-containing protein [Parabacteroides gordonii]
MKQEYSDIVNELLPRYCEGAVSPEERKIVEVWIKQSDENRRIAKQIHTIYLATDTINILEKVNTEKALEKVFSGMETKRRYIWWNRIQRIAAVLLIPALITIVVQNMEKESPREVRMVEVKTNPGMTTTLDLSDGTTVCLNSESTLRYPSSFEGDQRMVTLMGEAYFNVTKNEKQRFIVSTPHNAQIEVLGTSFNVEAFEKDTMIAATLMEGKIRFAYSGGDQSKSIVMEPGQKLVYDSNRMQARVYKTTGESEVAWKDGRIVFLDTPFQQALRMLEKRYNVEFVVSTIRYERDSFTGSFTNQRLERILEVFKISSDLRWRYIDTKETSKEKTRIEIY